MIKSVMLTLVLAVMWMCLFFALVRIGGKTQRWLLALPISPSPIGIDVVAGHTYMLTWDGEAWTKPVEIFCNAAHAGTEGR